MTRRGDWPEGKIAEVAIDVVSHSDLAAADLAELRRLFDAEYQQDFGTGIRICCTAMRRVSV